MLEYHALGALVVTDGDGEKIPIGGPRQRRLMAASPHPPQRGRVGRPADGSRVRGRRHRRGATTLRSYVARLRRVLDHNGASSAVDPEHRSSLLTVSPGYMLKIADENFDVGRFETMLATGRAALTAMTP